MGRPWLSVDEFDPERFLDRKSLVYHFDEVLEKKLSAWSRKFNIINSAEKPLGLKNYMYKDIIMDNYGDPVYDKNNNLIGYRIDNNKCVSIKTYYNENNLLCNKVSIREFDENTLSIKNYSLKNWVDIKIDTGFIREYNKKKYYYDINNNLINVESEYTCSSFPISKKDVKFDKKNRYNWFRNLR